MKNENLLFLDCRASLAMTRSVRVVRHCGLDPQSPTINVSKREIAGQARNDGEGNAKSTNQQISKSTQKNQITKSTI